jgi:selenocysteine lyase/cysteine desulfurase
VSFKPHYSRFLGGLGERLHFRAHSHHPWPDCTREAHLRAWDDAAARSDEKWDVVLGEQLPGAQAAVAAALRLVEPKNVAFAPNTHEFVCRLLSCLPARPRILTTDSEFHSFARQTARLEEDGADVRRVPVEPFSTFVERFIAEAEGGTWDLVFLSQVFFNSGLRLFESELESLAAAVKEPAILAVDGYHGFMAVPTDFSRLRKRAFYLAGGYKYAQAGEGACFLSVPEGCALRPGNTGWFADFSGLEKGLTKPVGYGEGGWRFWGSTFDPSGLYRWNAVAAWRRSLDLTVEKSDAHVRALQARFLKRLTEKPRGPFRIEDLISAEPSRLGHFLTFRLPDASALAERLSTEFGVLADARGDRLRFGFGLYHDEADVDALFTRLERLS